ncbi:retinal short-chain dehydrogenase reductase [Moniliophthora roreri MCA 2997]|uniref:Short-chain dehydrogenase/reductase 3 n=1 Tax=Moniliophthora roreri (strain MCA 2997) TaxID=1381753 RepID=V2XN46_MONRO|nr:retinal short-chain dehydrogenase reductase [Moniliophthora roreri MCA 2997]
MEQSQHNADPSPVFDSLDIDLVIKVLTHTAFSPFFIFFIPVFYVFQGAKITDRIVVLSSAYYVALCIFWLGKWCSRLWRNQGNLLFAPKRFDWGEQIVIITGGSSGIGELLANTLAVRNVTVVVLDIKPIVSENYNINFYKCDISKWEDVEAVSKKVIEEIGHPTVLVNNAGVVQGKLITDLTAADVQQTFGVNTLSHYYTLKAFLPEMIKKNSGHVVTVSSTMSHTGVAHLTDYCASKAALNIMHEALRYELDKIHKAPGVRTTLICPGHIATPLFSKIDYPNRWYHKFLVPSLAPITVVKALIQALDDQHSQNILMPFYAHLTPYLRHLPTYLQDFAHWMANADYAMANFTKVSGLRPEESRKEK